MQLHVVDGHDIRFAHLSTADGLSEMAVQQISQDDQGFMWFGTLDGLNRYDGYEFKVHKRGVSNAELGGTTVTALFKDRSGDLWIGVDQYLDRFDPITGKLTEYRHDPKISTSLGGAVFGITQDREDQIWLATSSGLDKLNPTIGIFTHFVHDDRDPASLDAKGSRNDVRFVGADNSDTLWVETSAGINSFDPKTGKASRFPQLLNHGDFHVQHVYQDHYGRVWIHSREGSGVGTFNPRTGEFIRYKFVTGDPGEQTAERVTAVLQDEQGVLWFGAQGSGLLKFDPNHGALVRYRHDPADPQSLSNNFVLCLYEDREGNIWAGTGGGGINRFPAIPSGFRSYQKRPGERNSLDQNFVLSVFEDSDGILWVGNDGVLNRIDPKTGGFTFYRHSNGDSSSISDGTVLSTVEDRAGTLWFGTYRGGLNSFDRRTGRFKAYRHEPGNPNSPSSDVIDRLQLDPQGSIWVAADHALDEFDSRSKEFKHYPELGTTLGRARVTCLSQDRQGMLWLGTNEAGLVRFDPATRRYDVYRNHPGNSAALSSDRLNALLVDTGGTLWVGTQEGLDRFDVATQQFHAYTEQDGLPSNAVEGILEDQHGNLWVGTDNGLARFTPTTRTVRNYYASDGLAGNEFNYWGAPFQDVHGEMFFPGVDGLTFFHPDKIVENRYVPPVLLTDFRLFGTPVSANPRSPLHQSISATQTLTLTHSQSVFSFGFSSLSYAYPERNRYRYMLERLEHEWNHTDSRRRFATYTTLAPGAYIFRVQGSNNHGVWNEKGVSVRIRILPPWWGTWWFRSGTAAFVALGLWSVHYLRLRTIERRNRELQNVIDTIPGYVWSAQPDGSVDFINRRWLEFSGVSLEKGLGWGWEVAVHPEDRVRFAEEWRAAVACGKPMETEVRVRRADGQYRWLLVRNVPLRDKAGEIAKWYGTSTDIEDRKRTEEERQRLRQVEADLAHINRVSMLGELAASIAHEVNQPLSGIVSNGSACLRFLARDTPDVDEAREAARDIVRDGKRAGEIIARIRALTKRAATPRETLDLNETIRDVLALVADEAKRKSVIIQTQFANDLPSVSADRVQLQQVLLNLIMNAMEAMSSVEERVRELVITTRNIEPNQVQVTVEDSGIGLDPNTIEKIFDSFYTTKPGGMGMGLSISRSILEAHGGRLWATLNDVRGTSFHFTLPTCHDEESSAGVAGAGRNYRNC